jgi:hypothetical protein
MITARATGARPYGVSQRRIVRAERQARTPSASPSKQSPCRTLSFMPVDGGGLRDPRAYKIALLLAWTMVWAARILWIPLAVYLFLMGPAGVLFYVVWSVFMLAAVVTLALLQRSGIRLVSMFYFDEVGDHAAIRAFFAKAMRWRRPRLE